MQLDPIRSIRLVIAAAALVTATLAGGCASTSGGPTIDPGEPTMVVYNAPPTILQSNDERKTAGANAIVGWHADLDDAEGPSARKIGTCNGTMQITRRSGSDQDVEHRMTMIELDWNDSPDSLVVGGSHPYPSKRIQSRTPIYRAILGGTGRFAGAMGEVVSIPLPSGWYRHEIWLAD